MDEVANENRPNQNAEPLLLAKIGRLKPGDRAAVERLVNHLVHLSDRKAS